MNPRRISSRELADLPETWENPTVDTSKYFQSVMCAFEVDRTAYEAYKKKGGLCQCFESRYYIA